VTDRQIYHATGSFTIGGIYLRTTWYCDVVKIYQGQSATLGSHCSRFHPNRFTFGGVIAERVNTVLLLRRVFPWFARSEASLWANNYNPLFADRVYLSVASSGKRKVTVWHPSIRPSVPSFSNLVGREAHILNVNHQGAVRDAAGVHFRPSIMMTNLLLNLVLQLEHSACYVCADSNYRMKWPLT